MGPSITSTALRLVNVARRPPEKLAAMFRENFGRFEAQVPDEVKAAGPQ